MSAKTENNEWSLSIMWSYIVSVTIVFLSIETISYLLHKNYEASGFDIVANWGIMLFLLNPVIFIIQKNKVILKAGLITFIIYFILGCLFQLLGGGWGGVPFNAGYFLFSLVLGLIVAVCALITALLNRAFSKNKS